jgi:hypothetical protein
MTIENDDVFFGQIMFANNVMISTLKNGVQLFQQLFMGLINHEKPLVWWAQHLLQFSHVYFLVCYVLGIVGS